MRNIYSFTNKDIDECLTFAKNANTSFYSIRDGQDDHQKRQNDSFIGKLGEYAAFNLLKLPGISVPDINIYSAKQKSWDYDLKSNKYNFHVKSQEVSIGERIGISWIFQRSDGHIFQKFNGKDIMSQETYNNIFKSIKDYVCFMSIDLKNNIGELKSVLSIKKLHDEACFQPTKLDFKHKKAVYYIQIKEFDNEIIF